MTASTFTSVSLDPPFVLVSIDNRSQMHRILPVTRRYGASILTENQEHLSNHFAGRSRGEVQPRFLQQNGVPLLEGAVAHFVVEVVDMHPAGDHTLYVSRIEFFQACNHRPLLFYAGQYQQLRSDEVEASKHFLEESW
jgi:flavin reductase (DIM6/NTAB) family NADH-FMN oxidoreductase RutF